MKRPTTKQLARMQWARKAVGMDGGTRNGFRWPVGVGGWVSEDVPAEAHDGQACGVGLHLGLTARGLSSAHCLTESMLLCVGYLPEHVVGQDGEKVRVERCWVAPGVTAGLPAVLRAGAGYGANLYGANLTGANLSRANLYAANLSGADLSGADLSGANLYGANLSGADLSGANLYGANLSRANLSRADLSRADLSGADLSGADLSGANLSGAYASASTVWPDGFDPVARGVRL